MTDTRRDVIRWITRLVDYGKGHGDPELDDLSLGQIADQIIAAVADQARAEERERIAWAIEASLPVGYFVLRADAARIARQGGHFVRTYQTSQSGHAVETTKDPWNSNAREGDQT